MKMVVKYFLKMMKKQMSYCIKMLILIAYAHNVTGIKRMLLGTMKGKIVFSCGS
jgi:hypothetical protein